MSVLLLKPPESRVSQTDTREERLWVVDLSDLTDIKEKLSDKVVHGIPLRRKFKRFSFGDRVLYHKVTGRIQTLHRRIEEACVT